MSRVPEEQLEVSNIERNPYSMSLPDAPSEFMLRLDEQQKIHREQHNKTQAGDTTFDYGLLLQIYPRQEYTLGSLGRFYHPDFGLIEARFCRLSGFLESDFQAQPVGRFKTRQVGQVDWTVTNDLSRSDSSLAAGFVFFSRDPSDDSFGWVVFRGPNPTAIQLDSDVALSQDTPVGWISHARVGVSFTGKELGKVWAGTKSQEVLAPGELFIDLERWSLGALLALVDQANDEIESQLATLTGRVSANESGLSAQQIALTELQSQLEVLRIRIQREEQVRANEIAALTAMISPRDWQGVINDLEIKLRAEYEAADYQLRLLIEALTGVRPFDPSDLQSQIDAVYRILSELQRESAQLPAPTTANQIIKSLEIPADPGSETPTSSFVWELAPSPVYYLDDLVDVDTPGKIDGSSLVWNLALGLWVPGPIPISDAPADSSLYARRNNVWQSFTIPSVPVGEAPTDGKLYVRQSSAWVAYGDTGVPTPAFTVSGVPAASSRLGYMIYVTNPAAGMPRPYWSDGTDWRDSTGTVLA